MKARIIKALTALLIIGILITGATLAYRSAENRATNIITIGSIDITLSEPLWNAATKDGTSLPVVYPGVSFDKDPTVKNVGSAGAYIRINLEYKTTPHVGEGEEPLPERALDPSVPEDLEIIDMIRGTFMYRDTSGGYVQGVSPDFELREDGRYYCKTVLEPGQEQILFSKVLFPAEWTADDTEKLGDAFSVIVKAEAIQSAGFEDGVDPATGEFVSALDWAWDVYNTYVYIKPGD
ncbi:MAG: hypothetical protein IJK02_01980 [Clostridia bacterium]|nr:hypothetical protein [Clostridia bacterium]